MDKKADEYGFTMYKEIFKAMAQTRFNEHKKAYENAKRKGKIGKDKDHPENDEFDLFHIDGSWIDGGDTPVGEAKGPTPTPSPSPNPNPDSFTIRSYSNANTGTTYCDCNTNCNTNAGRRSFKK